MIIGTIKVITVISLIIIAICIVIMIGAVCIRFTMNFITALNDDSSEDKKIKGIVKRELGEYK